MSPGRAEGEINRNVERVLIHPRHIDYGPYTRENVVMPLGGRVLLIMEGEIRDDKGSRDLESLLICPEGHDRGEPDIRPPLDCGEDREELLIDIGEMEFGRLRIGRR